MIHEQLLDGINDSISQWLRAITETCKPCTGRETSSVAGESRISNYTGDFPSPLQIMWYVPEANEIGKGFFPDDEIRGWVQDAAEYHGVPHSMLAVILQQENAPSAPEWRKAAQFAERSLTTFAAILDEALWDIVPDGISKGSSGLANLTYNTLHDAAAYTENVYGRNPMPDDVRYRLLGWDQDTRIPGDDYKADIYYAAAHVRQLIDRVTGQRCHTGELTPDQVRSVFRSYNGSGPLAEKYADDAMRTLNRAIEGSADLYFFQRQ